MISIASSHVRALDCLRARCLVANRSFEAVAGNFVAQFHKGAL